MRKCLLIGLLTGLVWLIGVSPCHAAGPRKPNIIFILADDLGYGEDGSSGIPRLQGFDYFFGYLSQYHAHNHYPDFLWRNEEKVPIRDNIVKDNVASKRTVYSQDLFTQEALQFIEKNKAKPFF